MAVVSRGDPVRLLDVIRGRDRRRSIFGLRGEEKLHGFGVAWLSEESGEFGALVTLGAPLEDLNVRRVSRAVRTRVAIAHIRCCVCDTCPATTYAKSSFETTQPLVAEGVTFAHVGIVAGHFALMKAMADKIETIDVPGPSDSAFLFRLFLYYYRHHKDLVTAVRSTLQAVTASGLSPGSSLNIFVADDAGRFACCRYRTPGDDKQPPPLWIGRQGELIVCASAPVELSALTTSWRELNPGDLVSCSTTVDEEYRHTDSDDDTMTVAVPASPQIAAKAQEDKARWLRAADAALRGAVGAALGAKKTKARAKAAADAKKAVLANLRKQGATEDVEAAVREFHKRFEDILSPFTAEELTACGPADTVDGAAARDVFRELVRGESKKRPTPGDALAVLQARLYDARFDVPGQQGNITVKDTAGVEEVKDVMASEANAFRRGLAMTSEKVRIVDFGAGDGRFCAEFVRASDALKKDLFIVAYEVSAGALRALRRRCLDGLGYTAVRRGNVELLQCRRVSIVTVVGDPRASALEVAALLKDALLDDEERTTPFDLVLSGWGSTSAIPDLPDQPDRQEAFIQAFAGLAPALVQIVSSPNNFVGPQSMYEDLRKRNEVVRLATRPGSFYYPVAGRDYFYSAVSVAAEETRLGVHFTDVAIEACNLASFRDLTGSSVLRKLETRCLHYVNTNDHINLTRFLLRAVSLTTKRNVERTTPLFDPSRTLVDQLARYLISVSYRRPDTTTTSG